MVHGSWFVVQGLGLTVEGRGSRVEGAPLKTRKSSMMANMRAEWSIDVTWFRV